jgi:hypothetical protein
MGRMMTNSTVTAALSFRQKDKKFPSQDPELDIRCIFRISCILVMGDNTGRKMAPNRGYRGN